MKESIKNALLEIGLSEKEAEVYIFISKRGKLTGTEITKALKLNRGQAYRLLKSLQKKEVIETTFEHPTQFIVVPFEKIVDSYIKIKREEVDRIEESKKDLISVWEEISHTELKSSLEKFSVLEGKKKIFQKISQMVKESHRNFSGVLSVSNLLDAERFGVFSSVKKKQSKPIISIRILTQPLKEDLNTITHLRSLLPMVVNVRGRNAELGTSFLPRLVARDNDEILIFITDGKASSNFDSKDVCLCTNSKCIVQSFLGVFKDCWHKSSSIEDKIIEIETGKSSPIMEIIKDPTTAKRYYYGKLSSVKEEILIITSSKKLIGLAKNSNSLKDLSEKGISIKIMAPITCENLSYVEKLLEFSEVRHIPVGYRETTIIDEKELFQFNKPEVQDGEILNFENVFFTNSPDYIKQTKSNLIDVWEKTHTPSSYGIRKIARNPSDASLHSIDHPLLQKRTFNIDLKYSQTGTISTEDVLSKIAKERQLANKAAEKISNTMRFFGQRAFALIAPAEYLEIPKMIIGIFKDDTDSSSDGQNYMIIDVLAQHEEGERYVPVACVQDSNNLLAFRKEKLSGLAIGDNIQVVEKNTFQVHTKGNTLFAGWTVPIPLQESNFVLPPACILFEGYGEIKSGMFTSGTPTRWEYEIWYNSLDAFATFFLSDFKYVSSGTEGFIDVESVWISKAS